MNTNTGVEIQRVKANEGKKQIIRKLNEGNRKGRKRQRRKENKKEAKSYHREKGWDKKRKKNKMIKET